MARTLLQRAGADPRPTPRSQAVPVPIDIRNDCFDGPLKRDGVGAATGMVPRR